MHVANHHDEHFKYLIILFVNYTSMKLKKNLTQYFSSCPKHLARDNNHWRPIKERRDKFNTNHP